MLTRLEESYEQEADRISEQVMARPAHSADTGARPSIQLLSGRSIGRMGVAPASVARTLAGSGTPLEPTIREDMEERFGCDFSRVRVHTGAAAERSAREVNADAYTVGRDIVFRFGRYQPGSDTGRNLLAHEIVHVVQQGAGAPRSDVPHEPGADHDRSSITSRSRHLHVLQRRGIAEVLTTSVNVEELTPEELRAEAALIAEALGARTLSEVDRQSLETKPQAIEDSASRRCCMHPKRWLCIWRICRWVSWLRRTSAILLSMRRLHQR